MRSRWQVTTTAAVMVSGLLALSSAPALAQGKPPAKAPAAPAKAPAKAAAPAKGPAKAPPAPKPLTEKQKKDAARKAYKEGEAKFKDGKYADALEHYKVADDLLPVPASKYKIAVCRDKLGQVVEAAAAYEAFLGSSPSDKMADAVGDAKGRLDALKKTPGKILLSVTPPNAPKLTVSVDGAAPQPAASLPVETIVPPGAAPGTPGTKYSAITVPPGHHKVGLHADGYDPAAADAEVPFARGTEVKVALNLTPPPPPPPPPPVAETPPPAPPPPPPAPRSNVPAYVTLGLAGAGVVVGTAFGVLALKSKSNFNSNPTTDNADATDRNALISDMSFAVALTFGVTGAVLLLSNDTPEPAKTGALHPAKKKSAVRGFVTPYAGPNGGGAVGVLSF